MKVFKKVLFIALLFCFSFCFVNSAKVFGVSKDEILDYAKNYDLGFYYKNLENNNILEYNSSKRYDPASTNKVPQVLYIYDLANKSGVDLNKKLTFEERHRYGGTGSIQNEPFGKEFTIFELCEKLIKESDNVAFRMLREYFGEKQLMDFCAETLKTPVNTEKYSFVDFSPKDLATHLDYLYKLISKKNDLSKALESHFENGLYNDKIPAGVHQGQKVLHKPGWINNKNLVCCDSTIIFSKDEKPYFLTIMSKFIPVDNQAEVFATLTKMINDYNEENL